MMALFNPYFNKWLFTLYFILNYNECRICSPGLNTPGYTTPKGDILIKHGDPLNITCILHDDFMKEHEEFDSRNLTFLEGDNYVDSKNIYIINSSAVQLRIDKPRKSILSYVCELNPNKTALCMNYVTVGVAPQSVEDFECIGYNYQNLTCTWTAPNNYAKTEYNLTYYFHGRAARRSIYTCPNITTDQHSNPLKMSCVWTISTSPQYRQAQRFYYFKLKMKNGLGTNELLKTFTHFDHVLPGPPENLTVFTTTTESILLHWSVPIPMQTFPEGLHHRVLYQCEYDKTWRLGGLLYNGTKDVVFNLTDLQYPHAYYDVRVSIRSAIALPTDESMWSKNSSITLRIASKVPAEPPKTTVGSFEVAMASNLGYREVYIYWQQINETKKNGDNFAYYVSIGNKEKMPPIRSVSSYAKFVNLSISENYEFLIWSENSVGHSVDKSRVVVPKQSNRIGEPLSFTKIAFDDGKYELSWEEPKKMSTYNPPVHNYTIFWCAHERDRPYQCEGLLNWTVVPSSERSHNVSVEKAQQIYQFAISANTEIGSSGMYWAACTIIRNKIIGKMRSIWINRIGSTFIEVGWKLDCADRIGSVEGFIIYYCPIVSPTQIECKGPQRNVTIHGDPTVVHGNITDLTPYTTYMLTVAVITKHSDYSQQSDPLYNTTLESAPTSPLNLNITTYTNTSINITWSPPAALNGVLRYYEVRINNITVKVEPSASPKYTLKNLTSYKDYNLTITACTISCSAPSEPQAVRTLVGYPGKVNQPIVSFQNDSYIIVDWEKPSPPGGKNDIFEVQLRGKLIDEKNKTGPIFNSTDTRYIIQDCGNDDNFDTFYVSVRAVNVMDGGLRYEGPWSDELESYCRASSNYLPYFMIPIVIMGLVGILYCSKRLYICCKDMRDVEVKLPPGLATQIATEHWNLPRGPEEPRHHSPADEELLLVKMGGSRQLSGDSSGCSSGHESVTSSVESGSNSSHTSDSGTEQPRSPSDDESRKNSLRLRNVATANRPNGLNSWSPKPPSPVNYCKLGGVDSGSSVEAAPSYVPISISQPEPMKLPYISCEPSSQSFPYVLTGDLNNPGSGYVPFNYTENMEKNPAYVLAGHQGVLVPELVGLDSIDTEEKSLYVEVSGPSNSVLKPADTVLWHPPSLESAHKGYVTVGDSTSPCVFTEHSKGYVPHRHFDAKSLKED